MKVLLIIESCNPEWASVPLVGFNFFLQISEFCEVTLVTHERNKEALEKLSIPSKIIFIKPSRIENAYYRIISRISTFRGSVIWPLRHALQYPIYFFFDRNVDRLLKEDVARGEFDIVHAMTPILPRYPVSISKRCKETPFLLGPVNGGVPFPKAFKNRGKREFSQLNFLRSLGAAIIPNYKDTYKRATLVLAGSTYTKSWIEKNLDLASIKVKLLFENGVPEKFYEHPPSEEDTPKEMQPLQALFVGRLVPYKGVDMAIKAISKTQNVHLTIVGNGPEYDELRKLTTQLRISDRVTFKGWIAQSETIDFYKSADIFCFPSVREFGGAVVMEAMAAGLPCIVVNNGGIAEYVDDSTGYIIPPNGEQHVIDELIRVLNEATNDRRALQEKSRNSYAKAAQFSWKNKGKTLRYIYSEIIMNNRENKKSQAS